MAPSLTLDKKYYFSTTYNRYVGDSLCDYGCSAKQFGKQCQSCSAYMSRVSASPASGYTWYDNNNYQCYQVSIDNGSIQWENIKTWSVCLYTGIWSYSNYS